MNCHIIRTNETLKDIGLIYNIDENEIKEANKHIKVWENLTPGLKIKLPEIPDSLALELDDVEPFIEDYYPKLDLLIKEKEVDVIDSHKTNPVEKETFQKTSSKAYQYPYYYYYPPYGFNYQVRGYYNYYQPSKKRK